MLSPLILGIAVLNGLMPEVLKLSEGRFWVDYGYHVAPIESAHLGEMDYLAVEHGVTSFKIFMARMASRPW